MSSSPPSSIAVSPMLSLDRLGYTPKVDCRQNQDEDDCNDDDGGREELRQVVAAEGSSCSGRRCDARRHDAVGDEEGNERHTEGLVDVQGCAGGVWILRHELCVRERGAEREHKSNRKRDPNGATYLPCDLAHQCVDAGPQDVSQDEEEKHVGADCATEAAVVSLLGAVARVRVPVQLSSFSERVSLRGSPLSERGTFRRTSRLNGSPGPPPCNPPSLSR
jgi:hypothetical protein